MPIITVHGLPTQDTARLEKLALTLQSVPCRFTSLEVRPDQVMVFFPKDLLTSRRTRLLTYVDLYTTPERTREIRTELATMIADELIVYAAAHLPDAKRVTIIMRSHDRDNGPCISRDVVVPLTR